MIKSFICLDHHCQIHCLRQADMFFFPEVIVLEESCLSISKFGFHTHSTLNGFLLPKYNHAYMGQHVCNIACTVVQVSGQG